MRRDPDDALACLEKARSDQRSAALPLEARPPEVEAACFHVQQAIEKSLKAVLVDRRLPVPLTHDVRLLVHTLDVKRELAAFSDAIAATTEYAVALRYPGAREPDLPEARDAMAIMERVLIWAADQLG